MHVMATSEHFPNHRLSYKNPEQRGACRACREHDNLQ